VKGRLFEVLRFELNGIGPGAFGMMGFKVPDDPSISFNKGTNVFTARFV